MSSQEFRLLVKKVWGALVCLVLIVGFAIAILYGGWNFPIQEFKPLFQFQGATVLARNNCPLEIDTGSSPPYIRPQPSDNNIPFAMAPKKVKMRVIRCSGNGKWMQIEAWVQPKPS